MGMESLRNDHDENASPATRDVAQSASEQSTSLCEGAFSTGLQHVAISERLKSLYVVSNRDHELRRKFELEYHKIAARQQALANERHVRALLEGTMLCLTGESQAGKSYAAETLLNSFPEFRGYDAPGSASCLLSLRAPPACTSKRLAIELLHALGYPVTPRVEEHRLWSLVYQKLSMQGVRVVHIDELQHASHVANVAELKRLGASLKSLLLNPHWPVMLFVVGVPELLTLLKSYEELDRRTIYCSFRRLDLAEAARATEIAAFVCRRAGFTLEMTDAMAFGERLIVAARHQFGAMIEWTINAVQVVLTRTDTEETGANSFVDETAFAIAYAEKTDCDRRDNPFLIQDWRSWIHAYKERRSSGDDAAANARRQKARRR